jgi:predicted glutamine amidotransferase
MCGIGALSSANPRDDAVRIIYEVCFDLSQTRGAHSWGATAAKEGTLRSVRSVGPVWAGTEFGTGTENRVLDGEAKMLAHFQGAQQNLTIHNRYASQGGVTIENTHPFIGPGGDWSLIHNGHVTGDFPFNKEKYHQRGQTDSEQILYVYLTHLDNGKSPQEALRECFRLNGRTNLIVQHKDGTIAAIASDALMRIQRDGCILYASEPVNVPTLGITDHDPDWHKVERGWVEIVKDGAMLFSQRMVEPAAPTTPSWGSGPDPTIPPHMRGRVTVGYDPNRRETLGSLRPQRFKTRTPNEDCPFCAREFNGALALKQHMLRKHPNEAKALLDEGDDGAEDCPAHCGVRLGSKEDLEKHLEEQHDADVNAPKPKIRITKPTEFGVYDCPDDDCPFTTTDRDELFRHLRRVHREGRKR